MLCHRMKQFREYHKIPVNLLADMLGITEEEYNNYESGNKAPDINTIGILAECYRVTIEEFYGYTPRLTLHTELLPDDSDAVEESLLKLGDLTWDEMQIILHYRKNGPDDSIIRTILEKNNP